MMDEIKAEGNEGGNNQESSGEGRSLARAMVDDPVGCVWTVMEDGRHLVVSTHPEQLQDDDRAGWYVLVAQEKTLGSRLLLKTVVREYDELKRFLTDASVNLTSGWQLSTHTDGLLERVTQASFTLWRHIF